MRLFLNGGGDGKICLQAYKKLNEIIDHKKPILYIPIAMEKEKYADCEKWIKNELKDIEAPYIEMITSGIELSNKNLENYSVLFIGGGNTFKLLYELKSSGAFEKIKEFINNNGVVFGGSAGAIIFGYDLEACLCDDINEIGLEDTKGFDTLNGYSLLCHYTNRSEEKDKNNTDYLLQLSYKRKSIALPEEDTIFINGKNIEIIGDKDYYLFENGNREKNRNLNIYRGIGKLILDKNLGNDIKSIDTITGGLMHKMFKAGTDKGIYCVKVLNPEVMSRKEAYGNFVVSESVSNLAKKNGIPVSSSLDIDGNYITKLDDMYYMVFDYIDGRTLKDDEITIEHCKKIGNVLAHIHSLDYKEIGLEPNVFEYKKLYDWESYINNPNFSKMSYKNLFLKNYKKYNSLLKRANERLNSSNKNQTICHLDMDPKNVMWSHNNPIIIDWECAGVANPERELLEVALCWSGFLSNKFSEEKFIAIFKEYSRYRSIDNTEWFDVICGNLVGRFEWLKYNLERSLGIVSNDEEEINLAENEVIKTIDEINRYLDLIGDMDDIITKLTIKETENYDSVMQKIVDSNEILKGKQFKLITAGFTNTIYSVDNYIIRLCTDSKNEERFENEINFYKENKDNNGIPKLYVSDATKAKVPYYYEVIEKVSGKTLYELWYRLSDIERRKIVLKIIDILRPFHSKEVEGYDFSKEMQAKIFYLKDKCNLDDELFNDLIDMCYKYFKENTFGLIHGDLHFDNFMFDGTNLHLLDFERCMVAPIDYEFRIFSKYDTQPYLWASAKTDMLAVESDYQDLIEMFLENYKELNEIPYINERLVFYSIIESIENYKNTKDEERMQEVKEKVKRLKLDETKKVK